MSAAAKSWPRTIAHADMDAFYAAVEQLDDPQLRGRPLLVGMDSPRSVVLTASYEARPYGVGSAMPMQRARKLCPQALIVPPRFARYQEISRIVMSVFQNFSPQVEALSLDEAFLDMTGSERLFGAPAEIGARIKAAVHKATGGLTASVGISGTRYVAKVASGFKKPDGLTIVPPSDAKEWLAPLGVEWLWGAGPKGAARLRELGLATIGQVACADPRWLERTLGRLGERFHALANAVDARNVSSERDAHSLSCERTLANDVSARAEIEDHLRSAAEVVAQRLRRRGERARGVRVKLKRSDFTTLTRQAALAEPTDVSAVLFARAARLLDELEESGPFRLVGIGVYDFSEASDERQLSLVGPAGERARRLESTIDDLADRFGSGVVRRAADLLRGDTIGVASHLDFLDEERED